MPSKTDFRYVPLYSLQPSRVPLLLLQGLHITLLFISHMMKINSFSMTQGKRFWKYLDTEVFYNFKLGLPPFTTLAGISPESIATVK